MTKCPIYLEGVEQQLTIKNEQLEVKDELIFNLESKDELKDIKIDLLQKSIKKEKTSKILGTTLGVVGGVVVGVLVGVFGGK